MAKKEFPYDPQDSAWLFDAQRRRHPLIPESSFQALMEAAPYDAPLSSSSEKKELIEPVEEAVESLQPWEQEILYMLYGDKLSLRVAGKALGIPKTTLARRRDAIWKKLESKLSKNQIVWEKMRDEEY
jgi:DNA-directed RNA polymerase specialized sigma subunit